MLHLPLTFPKGVSAHFLYKLEVKIALVTNMQL